jgi:hypothetical protein
MGFPIGTLAGIVVGCLLYVSTSFCAAAKPASVVALVELPPEVAVVLEPPPELFLELLHAASASAATESIAIAPAAARRLRRTGRRVVS